MAVPMGIELDTTAGSSQKGARMGLATRAEPMRHESRTPPRRPQRIAAVAGSLLLGIAAWITMVAVFTPDYQLDLRLAAAGKGAATGEIRWGERGKIPRDAWPMSLTALRLPQAQPVRIAIEPLPRGSVEPRARGNGVVVLDIATDLEPHLAWDRVLHGEVWTRTADASRPSGFQIASAGGSRLDPLFYTTRASSWISVAFLTSASSEAARVTVNGQTSIVGLFPRPGDLNFVTVFATTPPLSLERVGVLSLPVAPYADRFQIEFGARATAVRLYGLKRSGSLRWRWRPGMPLRTVAGTTITAATSEYVEVRAAPGSRVGLAFDGLPVSRAASLQPAYLLPALVVFLFALLGCRAAVWRTIRHAGMEVYATLRAPSPERSIGRLRWIILAAALALRVRYAFESPIESIGDSITSPDAYGYLTWAFWIKHGFRYPLPLDRLDLRGPGYAIFLAAVFVLLGTSYPSIIVAQAVVGLLTVHGGIRFGELLGSRWTSVLVGLFLAVAPDHLWYEHNAQTEALSLASTVWCSTLGLRLAREPTRLRNGLFFGLCSAAAIYNRPTLAILVGFWLAVTLVVVTGEAIRRHGLPSWRLARSIVLAIAVMVALVAPWVVRNGLTYGRYGMIVATNRARLILWMESRLLDFSLPRISQLASGYNRVEPFMWIYTLGRDRRQGERIAQALWDEQIAHHPAAYRERVGYVLLNLLGRSPGATVEGESRLDVRFVDRIYPPGQGTFTFDDEDLRFVPYGEYGPVTRVLGALWTLYDRIRLSISFLALLALATVSVWLAWGTGAVAEGRWIAIVLVGLGFTWVTTIVILAINIGFPPRYILPFDWIRMALIGGAIDVMRSARRARTLVAAR
jgi:hypothetical protein